MQSILDRYLEILQEASYVGILELFEEDAYIESPLEGKIKPADFYATLLSQTNRSRTQPFDIMIGRKWTAVYFMYTWTMEDGTKVEFDCVDLLEFQGNSMKIKALKIIYDTHGVRDQYEKLDAEPTRKS
jgi:hypothetical protein